MGKERKLLPCPFCGGEAEIERRGTNRCSMIYSCLNCGCRLETSETMNLLSSENSEWNTRFIPEPQKEVELGLWLKYAQDFLSQLELALNKKDTSKELPKIMVKQFWNEIELRKQSIIDSIFTAENKKANNQIIGVNNE